MNEFQNKKTVYVVDDHPIVRHGLVELINREAELQVIGEAEGAHDALKALSSTLPDIIIIDISLQGTSGIELTKDIKMRYPDLPVLVLSMHDEALYAQRALRAGAGGYIMKKERPKKVITAIRKIIDGEICVSKKIASTILKKYSNRQDAQESSPLECLSDRELEVFSLIGQGHGTRQIAEDLCLSVKTVESYRSNIKIKLGLQNSSELVQYAIQWLISENIAS